MAKRNIRKVKKLLKCRSCKSQLQMAYSEEGSVYFFTSIEGMGIVGLMKMMFRKDVDEVNVWKCLLCSDRRTYITNIKSGKEIVSFVNEK